MEGNKNQEPKIFKVLRIVAPCLLIGGIVLIVLAWTVFSKETWHGKDANWGLFIPGILACFFSFPAFFTGFSPKIAKTMNRASLYINEEIAPDFIKSQKRIQQANKEDLTDIASTGADISSVAVTKTVRAIKKGLKDTMFCKHCGAEIDIDSKFCNSCGGEQ